MKALINDAWLNDEQPLEGEIHIVTNGSKAKGGGYAGHTAVYTAIVPDVLDVFTTNNESVTVNGNAAEPFKSFYAGVEGDSINMSFDIVDEQGAVQNQIDAATLGYPTLLLPVTRFANGVQTDDEFYLSTTIVNGVVTVSGTFKNSGNWKLTADRINSSLLAIGATWAIEKDTVTFGIAT